MGLARFTVKGRMCNFSIIDHFLAEGVCAWTNIIFLLGNLVFKTVIFAPIRFLPFYFSFVFVIFSRSDIYFPLVGCFKKLSSFTYNPHMFS